MFWCAVPLPVFVVVTPVAAAMFVAVVATLCGWLEPLMVLDVSSVPVTMDDTDPDVDERGRKLWLCAFCVWLWVGSVTPWLCAGSSAVASATVLAPPDSPSASNSACPASSPTGTRPLSLGRLNVVEPSPTP